MEQLLELLKEQAKNARLRLSGGETEEEDDDDDVDHAIEKAEDDDEPPRNTQTNSSNSVSAAPVAPMGMERTPTREEALLSPEADTPPFPPGTVDEDTGKTNVDTTNVKTTKCQ